MPGYVGTAIFILIYSECRSSVLVSYGCSKKLPHADWLKTIEIYFFTILEARSKKSRYQQGWFLLGAQRENLFHAFLLTSGGFQQFLEFFGL